MDIRQPNKRYHANHLLVYSCQYHVIFCPKPRRPVLSDRTAERLKALILEKQPMYGSTVLEMDMMSDHVHLSLDVNLQVGVSTVAGQVAGYTAVGTVTLVVVKRSIEQQKGA
jgi:putative transposase